MGAGPGPESLQQLPRPRARVHRPLEAGDREACQPSLGGNSAAKQAAALTPRPRCSSTGEALFIDCVPPWSSPL